jgi:myo-inositol-1(or 4)-monophosphatase
VIAAPAELVVVAEAAAREPAHALLHARGQALEVEIKTSASDLVTQADRAAEAAVRRLLSQRRPHDGVLGEEAGLTRGTSGLTWVVDPLDGTTNYLHGIAYWATSVAVRRDDDGVVLAGAVYAPELGRLYRASTGLGAWLRFDDGRLRLLRRDHPVPDGRALVGTGLSYDAGRREAQGRRLLALLPHVGDVRQLGAASLGLCAVADGGLDAFVESDLAPYDFAAGALVAAEAGARVTGPRAGMTPDRELVLAAHPDLHELLLPACPLTTARP